MTHRLHKADEKRRDSAEDTQQAEIHSPEPTWFLHHANEEQRDALVSRYRQARNLTDQADAPRDDIGQRSYEEYRELIMSRPRPPARFLEPDGERESPENVASRPIEAEGLSLRTTFVIAALMAIISGGTVGFIASQYPNLKDKAQSIVAGAAGPVAEMRTEPARIHTVAATVIQKKPVATATLQVADVIGQTNSLIPLLLRAEPAEAHQNLMLKISGLPESAYLTTGRKEADRVWTLSMADLKDLKLMVPDARQREIDVAVAAFEKDTGELAAPVKSMTIALSNVAVEPAAAPPPSQLPFPMAARQPGQPSAIPAPDSVNVTLAAAQHTATGLAVEGDDLLRLGDVAGARRRYEKAWAGGSGDGALGMARSYDPVVLSSLRIKGKEADAARAIEWYGRAASAGKSEARKAIVRLRLKPQ